MLHIDIVINPLHKASDKLDSKTTITCSVERRFKLSDYPADSGKAEKQNQSINTKVPKTRISGYA